jgi:hypothetical protein
MATPSAMTGEMSLCSDSPVRTGNRACISSDKATTVVLEAGREAKALARSQLVSCHSSLIFEGKRRLLEEALSLQAVMRGTIPDGPGIEPPAGKPREAKNFRYLGRVRGTVRREVKHPSTSGIGLLSIPFWSD